MIDRASASAGRHDSITLRHKLFVPGQREYRRNRWVTMLFLLMLAIALGLSLAQEFLAREFAIVSAGYFAAASFLFCSVLWVWWLAPSLGLRSLTLQISDSGIHWQGNTVLSILLRGNSDAIQIRVRGKLHAEVKGMATGPLLLQIYGQRKPRYLLLTDNAKTGRFVRLVLRDWALVGDAAGSDTPLANPLPTAINGVPLPTESESRRILSALLALTGSLPVQQRIQGFVRHELRALGELRAIPRN